MASLIIAAWTWTIANAALADNPRWALVMAAIGGFAIGAQMMGRADEHWWRTRRSRVTPIAVRSNGLRGAAASAGRSRAVRRA